ncbi:hypothetical protein P168DRAFT_6530 [Aspergillus campestris IBT 28561]|uniref:Uncharacterized protein n=1 Tax=Aspergillus campestris (strain IBT 28561) TaxID=1392248 RepID=A0A2I1DDR8_ASPC2|nr:uncharacterized protein P168DRAFT_6530 [Aspergillus campestris IBT 28561]PKY08027.1 hypothetical protein P168DRAFT_6530 [Aspergillus campestris IBT 28561]
MKLSLSLGLFTIMASSVTAKYCEDHTYYCGWNLMDIGIYGPEINNALAENGIQSTEFTRGHSLFYCRRDPNDGVGYAGTAEFECHDGGERSSDFLDFVGP